MHQRFQIGRREFLAATLAAGICARRAGGEAAVEDVPWLAEVQTPPAGEPFPENTLDPISGAPPGGWTLETWQARRAILRQEWSEFLETWDAPRAAPALEVLAEDRAAGCLRQHVRYESEPGLAVEGYLLRPLQLTGRVPGVVAMHSTCQQTIRQPAGLEGDLEDFFAVRLAQQGCVAFCPRCFLWHDERPFSAQVSAFHERHPGSRGIAKMLWDAARGVDVLASLSEVDPKRLGAVGHSLGAKEALYLAAFDERIKVAVASEGGIGRSFSNWDASWYLGVAEDDPVWPRDHHELLALCAPRAFLIVGGDSADGTASWPYVVAAREIYGLYPGPVRLGLLNHRQGHAVPPEAQRKIDEWLLTYLRAG